MKSRDFQIHPIFLQRSRIIQLLNFIFWSWLKRFMLPAETIFFRLLILIVLLPNVTTWINILFSGITSKNKIESIGPRGWRDLDHSVFFHSASNPCLFWVAFWPVPICRNFRILLIYSCWPVSKRHKIIKLSISIPPNSRCFYFYLLIFMISNSWTFDFHRALNLLNLIGSIRRMSAGTKRSVPEAVSDSRSLQSR